MDPWSFGRGLVWSSGLLGAGFVASWVTDLLVKLVGV